MKELLFSWFPFGVETHDSLYTRAVGHRELRAEPALADTHPVLLGHSAVAVDHLSVLSPPHVLQRQGRREVGSVLVDALPSEETVYHERRLEDRELFSLAGLHRWRREREVVG